MGTQPVHNERLSPCFEGLAGSWRVTKARERLEPDGTWFDKGGVQRTLNVRVLSVADEHITVECEFGATASNASESSQQMAFWESFALPDGVPLRVRIDRDTISVENITDLQGVVRVRVEEMLKRTPEGEEAKTRSMLRALAGADDDAELLNEKVAREIATVVRCFRIDFAPGEVWQYEEGMTFPMLGEAIPAVSEVTIEEDPEGGLRLISEAEIDAGDAVRAMRERLARESGRTEPIRDEIRMTIRDVSETELNCDTLWPIRHRHERRTTTGNDTDEVVQRQLTIWEPIGTSTNRTP